VSYQNYLNTGEDPIFLWRIFGSEESIVKNILGITEQRVFHYKSYKKRERFYRDIPLFKIKYLENAWKDINLALVIIGAILCLLGGFFFLLFMINLMYNNILPLFVAVPLIIIGIILLIKGLKQRGYLLINNEKWKFEFRKQSDINKIEEFIRKIYSLIK